ncbi:MAG: 2,3-bisphosphoglycerate-independent phosphoglycerate mutase [Coriobacteriia bacterium]|nr:2,3-bisphosphoglycerate-independent phosphoglycerate mutase [Coriobacteriia bacterium]
MSTLTSPVALIILDGFGLGKHDASNAIYSAKTPFIDGLMQNYPVCKLNASGEHVGLPKGQMGNSEVGHLNIGAGRIVEQDFVRINNAIKSGTFRQNKVLVDAFDALEENKALHVFGLASHGGVHSELNHAFELMEMAAQRGVKEIYFHAFLDGRDVDPQASLELIPEIHSFLEALSERYGIIANIATMIGRAYAMDRNQNWERTKRAYDTIVYPKPAQATYKLDDLLEFLQASYARKLFDQDFEPVALYKRGVQEGDLITFFNFRNERARQLSQAFIFEDFDKFERATYIPVSFVSMTEYDPDFPIPVIFEKNLPQNVLADVVSRAGLKQYHSAETEKYAHVTFFINGGVEEPKEGESRMLVASPKVETYDLKPEMSAYEVSDRFIEAIGRKEFDLFIINYANCDMVGHTGNYDAAIKAVETIDECLSKVVPPLLEQDATIFITADHGNADEMYEVIDGQKKVVTKHTTNLVPFIAVSHEELALKQDSDLRLSDIAPTILECMKIEKPREWTGVSLLKQ